MIGFTQYGRLNGQWTSTNSALLNSAQKTSANAARAIVLAAARFDIFDELPPLVRALAGG